MYFITGLKPVAELPADRYAEETAEGWGASFNFYPQEPTEDSFVDLN